MARIDPPNNEQISRTSPDGRQVPSQAWALFHQQMAQQLSNALARIAALEASIGQPRVDGSGNQIFDFAPGTYIARDNTTGAVSIVVNSVVRETWGP